MDAEEIKEIRNGFNLSQKEFARLFDISPQMVYYWEKDKYSPLRFDLVILYRMKELFLYSDRELISKKLKKISRIEKAVPESVHPYKIETEVEKSRLGALLFFLFM